MTIEKEYEIKARITTEKICVKETMYCDVCDNIIDKNQGHWKLIMGSYDWDTDQRAAGEEFDICTEDCLRKKFDEYVEESGRNSWNSKYFDAERV